MAGVIRSNLASAPVGALRLTAMIPPSRDIARLLLSALVIGGLMLCSLYVVMPFLPATIWAITIVVATWPLMLRIERALWGSRMLGVLVTSVIILAVFVVPFWLAVSTIIDHSGELLRLAHQAETFKIPEVPGWIGRIPVIGPEISEAVARIEDLGIGEIARRLAPYAGRATQYFLALAGSFGLLVVQFLLTVLIAGIIHAQGEAAGGLVLRFARRLAGDRGAELAFLSGHAIRAVAVGVMVTAAVEAFVGGVGMMVAQVPLATVLTAVMFVVCVAQAGPGVVLIPVIIYTFVAGSALHGILLIAVLAIAIAIDTIMRPVLIRKEADLPTLLVLIGVIGGLAAFGLIGIFVGPAVLAVTYTLFQAWLTHVPDAAVRAIAAEGAQGLRAPDEVPVPEQARIARLAAEGPP